MFSFLHNLQQVKENLQRAAHKAHRDPASITVLAVTKTRPPEMIEAMIHAGHPVFAENRVQEATTKFAKLKESYPHITLHLIGPLQTNKVAQAVALFDVIQTVDRPRLAAALAKEMDKQGKRPSLFIQVNTGAEPQKAGVLPQNAPALAATCKSYGLKIDGLMCLPPYDQAPTPHFAKLRTMGQAMGVASLSMGMSDDYEQAIEQGATHIRVGTALFK